MTEPYVLTASGIPNDAGQSTLPAPWVSLKLHGRKTFQGRRVRQKPFSPLIQSASYDAVSESMGGRVTMSGFRGFTSGPPAKLRSREPMLCHPREEPGVH